MSANDEGPRLHFIRVSKTGSTTMKSLTKEYNAARPHGRTVVFSSHRVTMPAILGTYPTDQVVFFLRDPIARFVSGFNSRLREGKTGKPVHSPQERLTFSRFATPNDLAEALSSSVNRVQDQAYAGIESMMHSSVHYRGWVGDAAYLERRLDRIAFIGRQESFDADVRRLFESLGWTREAPIEVLHKAPPTASLLVSELGEKNLRAWYADDYKLLEWATTHRDRWAEGATLDPPFDEERVARAPRRARRERRAQRAAQREAARRPLELPAVGGRLGLDDVASLTSEPRDSNLPDDSADPESAKKRAG